MGLGLTIALGLGTFVLIIFAAIADARHQNNASDWARWKFFRFRLQVRGPRDRDEMIALGPITAGGQVRTTAEVKLEDAETERPVIVPADQRLSVQAVPAGVKGDDGIFRVPAGAPFWVLDAPEHAKLADGKLPARKAPWELTSEERPYRFWRSSRWHYVNVTPRLWFVWVGGFVLIMAMGLTYPAGPVVLGLWVAHSVASVIGITWRVLGWKALREPPKGISVNVTMVDLWAPLWVHALQKADDWILAPRESDDARVFVATMTDAFGSGTSLRKHVTGSVCHLIAEAILTATEWRARVALPVVAEVERRYPSMWTTGGIAAFAPFLEPRSGHRVMIWGEALEDLDGEGYVLRLSRTDGSEGEPDVIRGPLAQVVPAVIDWLVENAGATRRRDPIEGLAGPVPAADPGGWLHALGLHEGICLGKPESKLIPPPTLEEAHQAFDRIASWVEAHGAAHPQARFLALSNALEIQKHHELGFARKQRMRSIFEALVAQHPRFERLREVARPVITDLRRRRVEDSNLSPDRGRTG